MRSIRRVLPCLWLAVALLAPVPAAAEPKPPTAEENADATFAKSFVGKTYEDEFDIDGWTDLGGGWSRRRSMSTNISARQTAPISC